MFSVFIAIPFRPGITAALRDAHSRQLSAGCARPAPCTLFSPVRTYLGLSVYKSAQ